MGEKLIELTEDHLETGLRGVPVGYCTTSTVDPQKGLYYMGRPVSEMAEWDPERVIYLLWYGNDPSDEELKSFKAKLKARATLDPQVTKSIETLPREGHPMKLFCSALLIAGMLEGTGDYEEDGLNLVAKVPQIVATVINYHGGWGKTEPNPALGYMENFVHMLNVPGLDKERFTRVMRVFNVLHYDHGGGNLSCFTGKAVASGMEDMWGSLTAAMCALAGPRHGKANQDCLEQVQQLNEELGADAKPEDVEAWVRNQLETGHLIYGFGHAVLRVEDPRATIFYGLAEEMYPEHPLVKTALTLREQASKVLKENPKVSDPYPNVDAMSGTLLTAAGLPFPEYYTVLFGLARVVGIARQVVYERLEARGGKGTPIIRPKYYYKETTAGVTV